MNIWTIQQTRKRKDKTMKQQSNDGKRVLEIGSDAWILDNADDLKKELLRRAQAGEKPTDKVLLRALKLFTTPNQRQYICGMVHHSQQVPYEWIWFVHDTMASAQAQADAINGEIVSVMHDDYDHWCYVFSAAEYRDIANFQE